MTKEIGDVDYAGKADLTPGADYPAPPEGVSYGVIIDIAAGVPEADDQPESEEEEPD